MRKRRRLYIDFETRSEKQLRGQKSVGLYNYATDDSTLALMLGWAIDDGEVRMWFPSKEPLPDELRKALNDPDVDIVSFNSAFERYIFAFVLGIVLPAKRFQDPQPSARYLSLPADLKEVCIILGLPRDYAKDDEGDRLIDMFCQPSKRKKKRGQPQEFYWRDETTDPEDWAKFVEYCRQDVVAERECMRRLELLGVMPLPPKERETWLFDQEVNDRGIPVNREFVEKAYRIACKAKQGALDRQREITGVENPNSVQQMLAWARSQGYEPTSMAKELVAAQLEYNDKLTPACQEMLRNRKAAASTSYQKMETLLRMMCADDRVRNLFSYMGSSRCGRWSSNALQFHNMARPDERFEDEENILKAHAMIMAEDYEGIERTFGNPTSEKRDPGAVLLVIKSIIRTVFQTKPGKKFSVADENAIETRVAAWVSGCEPLLEVFRKNRDPYLDFAVKMSQIIYERLAEDIKSKDPAVKAKAKRWRQLAKPGVLGCVYRLSGGELVMINGVPTKTGLWGYAENMGVKMSREEAHEIVKVFREAYKEVVEFWYLLEKLVAEVLNPDVQYVVRECGPGGCIKIDRINIDGRHPILRIQLPSGRYLHYMDARIENTKMPWTKKNAAGEEEAVYKPTLVYAGQNQDTKQWGYVNSHGGKTFENIVQGIARDVLAHVLLILNNERDLPICGHVHDEGIVEREDDPFVPGLAEMEWTMAQSIYWAPGLPLKGDGFEDYYYHK